MGIRIPRIQPIQSAPEPRSDRLNVRVQDQAELIQANTQSVSQLGKQAADLAANIEDQKIKTVSDEAEQKYRTWNNTRLAQLRSIQGDPAKAYAEYEAEEKQKAEEILAEYSDVNERVKGHLAFNLNRVQASQRTKALTQQAVQRDAYAQQLFQINLDNKLNDMPIAAGSTLKNPITGERNYANVDNGIADLRQHIAEHGLRDGSSTKNEDGTISLGPLAQQRYKVALSTGLYQSVKALNDSGYTEDAKALREKYREQIDSLSNNKLDKMFKTADTNNQAYGIVDSLLNKSPTEQQAGINKIKNPQIKLKVSQLLNAESDRRAARRNEMNRRNFEVIMKDINQKRLDGTPYYNLEDLQRRSKTFSATWGNLSSKQQQAILDTLKPPKSSDPQSRRVMLQLLTGQHPTLKLEEMSAEQLSTLNAGLAKSDQNKLFTQYKKLVAPDAGERRQAYRFTNKLLTDILIQKEEIDRDDFGKLDGDELNQVNELQMELIDQLDEQPSYYAKPKELTAVVNSFVAQKLKNPDSKFILPPRIKKGAQRKHPNVDNRIKYRWKKEYMRLTGRTSLPPDTDAGYIDFAIKKHNQSRQQ